MRTHALKSMLKTRGCVLPLGLVAFALCAMPAAAAPFAYVTNSGSNTVSVIDRASNTVVATVLVGLYPVTVALTPDGAFAYVTNCDSGTVSVIATATNAVVATVPVGTTPLGVAITPNGAFAYVADWYSNAASVIDTSTNSVTATVPVGVNPWGVSITPDGALAYVADTGSNAVSVITTANNTPDLKRVVATVPVGAAPVGVAITPDGAFAYVANRNDVTVSVIATASNTVVSTVPVGGNPHGVAITPDGAFAYVAVFGSNFVSVIATATNTVVATIPVGCNPTWVAFSSTSGRASANLLTNGSFENGCFVNNGYGEQSLPVGSTAITGWTTTTAELVWFINGNEYGATAQDGSMFLDLTGHHVSYPYGGVSQTVNLAAGDYTLTFYIGAAGSNDGPKSVYASAGNQSNVLFTFTPAPGATGTVWQQETLNFSVATAGNVTISLVGNSAVGSNDLGLDNVDLEAASAVPTFGGSLKTSTSYEFSLKQSTQDTESIQLTNPGATSRSATISILNPYPGLTVSLSPPNPITVAPGETQNIPILIDAGPLPVGTYDGLLLKVAVDDGTTLYANIKIYIVQQSLPDLTIASSDISYTVDSSGTSVTLTAAIHNQGSLAASNVQVNFYEFANLLGQTVIASIPAQGTVSTSIDAPMAGSGDHLVRVVIDPSGLIQEIDKTNNEASTIVHLGGGSATPGSILVTGSLPSQVYAGSLFNLSGQAFYDVYVNGIENTDYAVEGGAVQVTIVSADGTTQWVYGDFHTDIYGNFLKSLQAPTAPGSYRIVTTVTDNTFIGSLQLVFSVIPVPAQPPPPPQPLCCVGPGGTPGTWTQVGPGVWQWTPPPNYQGPPIPQSDLSVYSEDIYFSNDNPAGGEAITVFAEIHYWAQNTTLVAQNVPVNFYVTSPGSPKMKIGRELISSLSVGAPDYGSHYVYATWMNQGVGIYIMEVEIDPSYVEQYMLNNAATRAIIVGQLQTHQGAISGQVTGAFASLSGVTINLFNVSGGLLGSTLTDSTGSYLFQNVPVGQQQVQIVTPSGYQADAVKKTATVTDSTVTVVDFYLTAAAAAELPDLTVSKTHNPTIFKVNDQADTFAITVINNGSVASSGTVTVSDMLPAGLTYAGFSGTGWACSANGQLVTCTTTNAIAASSGTSRVTISVNVASSTQSPLTNNVSVACTCTEANTNNNANTDQVTVIQSTAPTFFPYFFYS